ncbi:class II aldolase and Adducin N-terminal domain-containing protein [Diplogelasinospora grovesii]|uniref:Class II aldolase and Adducin N-terminal domain-containing protein n=1 Tax=Diplogelasinospora grovesii TaxID=303347 RepID=A0AAN6NDN4_9PEZI|nr:class II aldolase and Adducin N-terminal domain-containing protein [Diplogelasinospora grovesii]
MESDLLQNEYRKLITGNHILHYHGVLDAYGHLSIRNPLNPETFILSRQIAPALISSIDDLVEYYVETGEPLCDAVTDEKRHYSERYIHSAIYRQFAEVNAVVHSHSEAVLPYTICGVELRACYHMAGFLSAGGKVSVFDIANHARPGDGSDMLVRNTHLGSCLSSYFSTTDKVESSAVLMRGHGFTAVGDSVENAVLRAIYTQKNAAVQTATITLQAANTGIPARTGGIKYLSEKEAEAADKMTKWSAERPWALWVREIQAAGLYVNHA